MLRLYALYIFISQLSCLVLYVDQCFDLMLNLILGFMFNHIYSIGEITFVKYSKKK